MTANDSGLPRNGNDVAVADAPGASASSRPKPAAGANDVVFKLNGEDVAAVSGETIIEAAQRHALRPIRRHSRHGDVTGSHYVWPASRLASSCDGTTRASSRTRPDDIRDRCPTTRTASPDRARVSETIRG